MEAFRIFLSYSHEDRDMVEPVAAVIKELGFEPIYDRHIQPGVTFSDAIKSFISHAHVFIPLITDHSRKRPWVHQEIGFAMALNIPVLPIAVASTPGEMIAQLQAVTVQADLSDLRERISAVDFERLVLPLSVRINSMIELADWPEQRVEMMARHANKAIELGGYSRIRQRGGLTTFSVPDRDTDDPIWRIRDGAFPRSDFFHHFLREERRSLERHAKQAGCDLIIDPTIPDTSGVLATGTKVRLLSLRDFLVSLPASQTRVVCSERARDANVTVVGNWFSAQSKLRWPGQGWRQTIFDWHPPTVLRAVREFDELLATLLAENGVNTHESRDVALEMIDQALEEVESRIAQEEEKGDEQQSGS